MEYLHHQKYTERLNYTRSSTTSINVFPTFYSFFFAAQSVVQPSASPGAQGFIL